MGLNDLKATIECLQDELYNPLEVLADDYQKRLKAEEEIKLAKVFKALTVDDAKHIFALWKAFAFDYLGDFAKPYNPDAPICQFWPDDEAMTKLDEATRNNLDLKLQNFGPVYSFVKSLL